MMIEHSKGGMFMLSMSVVWLGAAVVFAVIEALTYQLVSIWFAGGAVVALIAQLIKPDMPLSAQLGICAGVAAVLLAVTRPFVKKLMNGKTELTNVDALIGKKAVITAEVDNINSVGEAQLDGKIWTARSADNSVIAKDSIVTVEKIDGVKLIVKR